MSILFGDSPLNGGPTNLTTVDAVASLILPGVYTFASLLANAAPDLCPIPCFAYCSDTGLMISNGVSWSQIGSGGAVAFTSTVTATLAASQNNYAPTGYTAGTTNRLLLAAASGGSTITGLLAATDGWALLIRNTSTTDNITFPHLSGSSTATNQFSCQNGSSATLEPLASTLAVYVSNVWVLA